MSQKVVVIGCSHLSALLHACLTDDRCDVAIDGTPLSVLTISATPPSGKIRWPHAVKEIGKNEDESLDAFGNRLSNALAEITKDSALVISLIGGNGHNIMSLVEHERPFDFVLREEPNLPLLQDREIIANDIIHAAMEERTIFWVNTLCCIRQYFAGPLIHVESPPPIFSEEHIKTFAGKLAPEFQEHGIAPPSVRYKAWKLHSKIFRTLVTRNLGGGFLTVPRESQDEHGFLLPHLCAPDPFHASAEYGKLVYQQLAPIITKLNEQLKIVA